MAGRLQERCGGCGAAVGIEALTCEYCGVASPHARRASAAASEAELAEAEARLRVAEAAVHRSGKVALVWSVVGVALCCLPVGSVVALLLAQRARTQARAAGLVAPSTTTAAMILGGLGLAAFVAFAGLVAAEMRAERERTAQLHALTDEAAAQPELTQPTACGLAELRLIEDGWDGRTGSSVYDTFECPGRVHQDGAGAVLEGMSIRPKRGERILFDACLERGEKWFVRALVPGGQGCAPADAPAPP